MEFLDLHCDLLSYLEQKEGRNPENDECRCSLKQLKKGSVVLQTLAIFTDTTDCSVKSAQRQMQIFLDLPHSYPDDFVHLKDFNSSNITKKIGIAAAIENASGLCLNEENLENGFKRLDEFHKKSGSLLYLSLTWKYENRFGGGNLSKVGLKREGELLLDFLSDKKISIDLSHASDPLADDILNYIDKKNLKILPIASHSNFREITKDSRNLPDFLAKEVIRRGGIIGLNFVEKFVGGNFLEDFIRHIEYAKFLGGREHLALGADFFYDEKKSFFSKEFANSSCYPELFSYLEGYFTYSELERIAKKNFEDYLNRRKTL